MRERPSKFFSLTATFRAGRSGRSKLLVAAAMILGCGLSWWVPAARAEPGFSHTRAAPRTPQLTSSGASARPLTVRIYLIALGGKGISGAKIGCGDGVVEVRRVIAPTSTPLAASLRLLLSDHRRFYGQSGLYNALYQSRLRVVKVTVAAGQAGIYLQGQLRLGGVCDSPRVQAQLQRTASQFPGVRRTAIFINQVPLSKLLSGKG